MNSAMKRLTIGAGSLVVLAIAGGGGLRWWLAQKFTRESVVAQLESSWNCRADVGSVNLALGSNPARLEISDLKLAASDAENLKPLAQRAPITPEAAAVTCSHAVLEVRLQDLLSRTLNVQKLVLSDVGLQEDVSKEGVSSLGTLFAKPVQVQGRVALETAPDSTASTAAPVISSAPLASGAPDAAAPPAPPAPLAQEPVPAPGPAGQESAGAPLPTANEAGSPKKPRRQPKVFEAKELGMSVMVAQASLERGQFHRVDHKSLTKTDVSGLDFSISDIDVNPADLASHNTFKLALNGKLTQRGRIGPKEARREVIMADIVLRGEGIVHPFDADTGLWQPNSDLRLTMTKDTVIGGYMTLGDTGSKDLKKLDDYGIDLRDLKIGGPLLEDAVIRVTIEQNRIMLQEDAKFAMPDFELLLQKESWLNPTEDEHEMQIRLTCGPLLQEQLSAKVKKFVGDEFGGNVIKSLSDEKGRIYFEMLSTGRLSKPAVKPDVKRLLNRVLEGVGGGLLDGLIKKKK